MLSPSSPPAAKSSLHSYVEPLLAAVNKDILSHVELKVNPERQWAWIQFLHYRQSTVLDKGCESVLLYSA